MLDPASKATNHTFVLTAAQRHMLGDLRKLDMLSADNPTNQVGQCVQVLLGMAGAACVQGLRQGPFDGTIRLEVDEHQFLGLSGLVAMTP